MKVLFIYPNTPLLNPPPVSIGTFAAILKPHGIEVAVFDTTFYTGETSSDEAKEESLQVRPFRFDPQLFPEGLSTPEEDLRAMVDDFQPDLIALSTLEATWGTGAALLDALGTIKAPVVVGGIFPTFAPEIVIKHPQVSMICVGEGDEAILELCQRIRDGRDYSEISNLWVKEGDTITRNPMRLAVDVHALPMPDYSVFHKARFLRPMAGRVYRTIPLETNRGCPFTCTFCNSPTTARMYRDSGCGTFFRKKSMDRIQAELRFLIHEWDAEYCYFLSDTFLAMSNEEFDHFIDIYQEFKLPFWIQSRAETITSHRANKLKEIGCHRISIGLEHGNEDFRHKILKKKYSNEQMIKAGHILAEAGIPLSLNNIIGFPDETRELIFDTIELNRQIPFDTSNAYAFTPFHGTPLHSYCLEKGYISADHVVGCLTMDTPLDMPQLSREEISGLRKTFALYARMDKEYWPEIRRAEKDDEEGRRLFKKLRDIYVETFFL